MFRFGVECDHIFGSKWLINELFQYGFSLSYSEITRYKQSVVSELQTDLNHLQKFTHTMKCPFTINSRNIVTQFVADNVDHNIATIDGKGTFHGMGIIAISTPLYSNNAHTLKTVIERKKYITSHAMISNKGVPIQNYIKENISDFSKIKLTSLEKLTTTELKKHELKHFTWKTSWYFNSKSDLKPNWSGYMQNMLEGQCPGKPHVTYLPIIDLNLNDDQCIYSTLKFIEEQSASLNIDTPVITFDQPLWLKAANIIFTKHLNIVCRLGGFHLIMSFLGSIGKLMEKSGIEEALGNIYGPNAVIHVLNGKAYSRSIRGHFLLQLALTVSL